MTSEALSADLVFVGHVCFDEIVDFAGQARVAPGSAVLCGAVAAARAGATVAVVTKMSPQDQEVLTPLRQAGVAIHVIPAADTTYMRVEHPSSNLDDREMYQVRSAGLFDPADIPRLDVRNAHLAGITDQEFDLGFVQSLRARGYRLSADMQSFVRQVDPATRRIAFSDVADKARIAQLLDVVKLDVVEARVLTGTDDLERAAMTFEEWGCPETIITRADGVLARANGVTFWEAFTNRTDVGRTGRGDTVFGAYLARRLAHDPKEALRFAAALVSLKMEKPGPYDGTLADVLERLHSSAASATTVITSVTT